MAPLPAEMRRMLENAVVTARKEAEAAADATLTTLAVFRPDPYPSMTAQDRRLRNALRARGRSLGDNRLEDGKAPLVEEIAYQAWHRMLFARFLAENNLLMHPSGASLTIEICDELAREERQATAADVDAWEMAARYAADTLPGIFAADDPTVQAALRFAPEGRVALERILTTLPAEVFTADDALGWIYQFWQSENKERVNASERKIGAEELPAVTQLFTEDYMVRFLLENSLGAWWAARHPDSPLLKSFDYLRFRDDGTPAAGTFPHWPEHASEVTVMDPCCGSGHFLVAAFEMLRRMRQEEEGLDEVAAGDAVLRDNLFGLELDPRCTQIAAFALALAAWKAGGYRELPLPQVACSGIAVTGQLDTWRRLAGSNRRLADGLQRLYFLFKQAPTLGSLIDPNAIPIQDRMFMPDFAELEPLLAKALERERAEEDPAAAVFGEAARGVARAARFLADTYTLVATNVPYLGQRKQDEVLRKFCQDYYPHNKANLAAAFVERCLRFSSDEGSVDVVVPRDLLYKVSYTPLREMILDQTITFAAVLGPGAFREIGGEVVDVALLGIVRRGRQSNHEALGLDVSRFSDGVAKQKMLRQESLIFIPQSEYLERPARRIDTSRRKALARTLAASAIAPQGIKSGDDWKWIRYFWEIGSIADDSWRFCQTAPDVTAPYRGRERIIDWRTKGQGMIRPRLESPAVGKTGVGVSQTGGRTATLYSGDLFDSSVAPIIPTNALSQRTLWALCSSQDYLELLDTEAPGLHATNSTVLDVPFDLDHWDKVAEEQYPDGLPEPYSNDPTQWLFKGNPADSTEPFQVGVARLLGYRWPEQGADGLERFADPDGIVPLQAMGGERAAAERLRELLAASWGDGYSPAVEARLLAEAGYANRTLDDWLLNGFFEQHVRLFQNRPFIWHIWDGRRDGFNVLVNYHTLDGAKLDRLIYSYLGPWITRQRAERDAEVPGADARLAAALRLEEKLKAIREGEQPYDIYVRWRALHEQPMGWEPDLNDGVRLNIRPWIEPFGKASESPLRARVNVNWKKDRGKNPDGSERHNDVHLSLAEKRAARAAVAGVSR